MEFQDLPDGKFPIIYADPPYDYKGQTQHNGKGGVSTGGAPTHYDVITLEMLSSLPVEHAAADDALLFLWATSPHLDQAIELGKAWGFKWATVAFVWDKKKLNPGFYTMSQCELCLVFKRGRIPKPRGIRNERQLVSQLRGHHSAKPNEVRSRIERMFPDHAKLELFARNQTPGWSSWGLEMEKEDAK